MDCRYILKQVLVEKICTKHALCMFSPIDALHRTYGADCFDHLEDLSAQARMLFGEGEASIVMSAIRDAAKRLSFQLVGVSQG